jgi:polysaccharide export outer membrane protein
MRRLFVCCVLAAAGLGVAGCSTPRGAAMEQEIVRGAGREDASFQVVAVSRDTVEMLNHWPVTGWSGSYRWIGNDRGPQSPIIRPGDSISLTIWDSQQNSLITPTEQRTASMPNIPVSPEGTIFVPYIGEVEVRGLTPSQAREKIQNGLLPVVPAAQVQISVEMGRFNSVDVVTGVPKPGSYPLADRNTTILSIIAQSGGVSDALRNPLVRLIRGRETYEIRAETLFADASQNTTLVGGDKVLIEEDRRFFTSLGASGREELVYFDRDRVSALEALSLIGGLADTRANPRGVLILRDFPKTALRSDGMGPEKERVVFALDLTNADGLFAARVFNINPGDTIYVTESTVVAAQSIFGLVGTVFGLRNEVEN